MNENSYALLIGIDKYSDELLPDLEYSEKDCHDLSEVLTDPEISAFPKENVTVITGREATTDALQEALFSNVVSDRNSEDYLIVYFSGHAFVIRESGRTYIASQDVKLIDLKRNPMKGISMQSLHDEIFKRTKVKNLLFILDTCYSGAIFSPSLDSKNISIIDERFSSIGEGRTAIVSCPYDASARECSSLKNGVFTYYLIEGLKGAAAEIDTGEVTIDSILSYLRKQMPPNQPAGRYGQDFTRWVLSNTSNLLKKRNIPLSINLQKEASGTIEKFVPLENPLTPYQIVIDSFCNSMVSIASSYKNVPETHLMESIRCATKAEISIIVRLDTDGYSVRANSDPNSPKIGEYLRALFTRIDEKTIQNAFAMQQKGFYCLYDDGTQSSKAVAIIPLRDEIPKEVLIISGLENNSIYLADPCAEILKTIYSASNNLLLSEVSYLEAAILDSLKRAHGFIPYKFYERRFELFKEHIKCINMYFQPIVSLAEKSTHICGWEALARDPVNKKAPSHLFKASETWGSRFMIELDSHILGLATKQFRNLLSNTAGFRRPADIQDLSVNVYPQSLMRTAYYNAVKEVIDSQVIPADKLFLEISEKTPIPTNEFEISKENFVIERTFRGMLEKYVTKLGIGFAIDDFGVGHASITTLAKLHPSYVKIDQEILSFDSAYDILEFAIYLINSLVSKRYLRSAKIVIEGFGGRASKDISLSKLYQMGIRYIQGYMSGEAKPEISRLDRETEEFISSLLAEGKIMPKKKNQIVS